MSYDNRYNGALFTTREPSVLAGPFQLEDESARLRVVCTLNGAGEGRHDLAVFAERADGKGLKKKPVARGWIQRFNSNNAEAPVAKGHLGNSSKRIQIAVWKITAGDDTPCYQIKPDRLRAEAPADLPEL